MTAKRYNFVFDLDDTLYAEREYSISALKYFGRQCHDLGFGSSVSESVISLYKQGEKDAIGLICHKIGINDQIKADLVSNMQAHLPQINLREDAGLLITAIRASNRRFSIITDGRSVTQRSKIEALGLTDAQMIMISEEVGVKKPDLKSFMKIARQDASASFMYVGDNPRKDFIAPNQLGWLSVMLIDRGDNVHTQSGSYPLEQRPQVSINTLTELLDFV